MINNLIRFCKENFDKHKVGKCNGCQNNCVGCKECLEEIHKPNGTRHYDCNNACCYYVCHHILRYSSEIEYALRACTGILASKSELRICSIGCGPSSELYGMYNYLHSNNFQIPRSFVGFERNNIWKNIHDFINRQFIGNISFEYVDAFQYYTHTTKPNVIILNYVLSDILKYNGLAGLNSFIAQLYNLYLQCETNAIIIINDTNIGIRDCHIRYHFSQIEKTFINISRTIKAHFNNSYRAPYAYGNEYQQNIITSHLTHDISNFNPWLECRSAQLIIAKT